MNSKGNLITSLFKLDDIGKNFSLFFQLLPEPLTKTLNLAQKTEREAALSFLGFGYAVLALFGLIVGFEQPGLDGFGWGGKIIQTLIQPIGLLVYFVIYYRIFKDVSRAHRSLDEYVSLCGVQGGFLYILSSAIILLFVINPRIGVVGAICLFLFSIVYSVKLLKNFWDISYGKVILYSFISGLLSMICMFMIFLVIGVILAR